jgi:uncharacterized membrane protein YphA (DoxX/SURF4 family)
MLGGVVMQRLFLLMLCAAYIQGSVEKLLDFNGAVAEMQHFGLPAPGPMAAAVIAFELAASAMVISGWKRWMGAGALAVFTVLATFLANRFWDLPPGHERMMAENAFFEHIGLAGAFLLVAWHDLRRQDDA